MNSLIYNYGGDLTTNSVCRDNSYNKQSSTKQGQSRKRSNCSISYVKHLSHILRKPKTGHETNLAEEKKIIKTDTIGLFTCTK